MIREFVLKKTYGAWEVMEDSCVVSIHLFNNNEYEVPFSSFGLVHINGHFQS